MFNQTRQSTIVDSTASTLSSLENDSNSLEPIEHLRDSIISTESDLVDIGSNNSPTSSLKSSALTSKLGDLAPVWLHDSRVTMCYSCTTAFNFLNRRHHCRACGYIFCADCSSHQFPLKYQNYKSDRVCDSCYEILSKRKTSLSLSQGLSSIDNTERRKSMVVSEQVWNI